MAAPTLLDYAQSNFTDVVATVETTADLDWAASGDRILALGMTEDNGVAMATPTGTGITLAALSGVPTNVGSRCKGYGWSATASGNGNTVLTSTNGASGARGVASWAFSGSDGFGTPVTDTGAGITVSVTVAQADSTVCMILGDWNATTDVAVTTTPAGGTVRQINATAVATFAVVEWTNQAVGTRSYGLASWTGTGNVTKVAVEVLGSGASPGAVTLTPVTVALTATALTVAPAAPTLALTPATIAGQAVALSPAAAPVTVSLTPVVLSIVPTPIAAAPVVTLTPVVVNLAPRPLTLTATVALTAASATLTPVPLSLGSAGAVTLTPAVAALSARPLTLTPVHALTPVLLALSARPLTPVPGAPTVALTPVLLALTAQPLTPAAIVAGAVSLTPVLLALAGVPLLFGSQNEPGSMASDIRQASQLFTGREPVGSLSSDAAPMGAFLTSEQAGGIA
jgi:hypothetical protein